MKCLLKDKMSEMFSSSLDKMFQSLAGWWMKRFCPQERRDCMGPTNVIFTPSVIVVNVFKTVKVKIPVNQAI